MHNYDGHYVRLKNDVLGREEGTNEITGRPETRCSQPICIHFATLPKSKERVVHVRFDTFSVFRSDMKSETKSCFVNI